MRTIILALLLSLALAQSYEAWTADFQAVAPQWGTGYFDGTIKYDWPAGFMQIVFNNAGGYTEFYQFNTGKGYDTKVSTGQFTYQYLYKSSTSCPCETLALQFAMPPLFSGSVATGAGGQITSLDFWTTKTNPVQEKTYRGNVNQATQWFANKDLYVNILDSNGQPSGSQKGYFMSKFFIMANDASGLPTIPAAFGISDEQQRTFNLLNVKNVATGSLGLKPPTTGCKCGKLLDIVVSLDRSGSISNAQWALEYAFVKNLTGSFEYDSTKANFGLVNWNAQQWDTIAITSGTSAANVNTAINAMKCCSTDTRSTSACCCCGTPIGGGIWGGYNMISKSSRSKATKVLVVLTDGCQNHLWYPPSKAVSCGCTSEKACAANTTCTGDITKYYKIATNNIPNLKVLAVGVGDANSICQDQLLLAAGGDPTNVFNPQSWDQLGSIVQTISATACTADNVVCPGCCGICTCGVCQPATKCDSPDLCNIGTVDPVTGCCTTTPVTCTADPCNRAFCSPSLGCQQEKISCKLPVDCIEYYCDPALNMTSCATRAVKDDPDCSTVVVPECVTNEDCSNNNLCLPETCTAGKCVKGEATKCKPDTKCTQYQCKPTVGCVVTSTLKCNDNNNCTIDSCDDLNGCTYQNVTCKKPNDPCQDVICDTTLGCLTVPVTCSNLTAGNCTVPACNRTCYLDYICFTPPPTGDSEESFPVAVVTAASIGTAAAVGIALGAAVLVAGAGGGAAVAIAGAAGAGGVVMVQSNPVYQGAGTAGSNPLHKGS